MMFLVVDDEQDYANLLAYGLRQLGHQVLLAKDGQEGLNLARRQMPDLIVLDLMMPGLDGFAVCELLRAQPSTKSVPIAMLTAKTGEIARLNSLAAGANDFFTKTTPLRELLRQLDAMSQSILVNPMATEAPGESYSCNP